MINEMNFQLIKSGEISWTGLRLLIIFAALLEKPLSAKEIQNYFEENHYPSNLFSKDTLRNDINALKLAGCEISRADKANNFKYHMISNPFNLQIDKEMAKSLYRVYDKIYTILNFEQLILLENLFEKFANYTKDKDISEYLKGISLLSKIDKNLLQDLNNACLKHQEIEFNYNAPNTGLQKITMIADDLEFRSKKLYITGYCITYGNNSFLRVSNIQAPIIFHLNKTSVKEHVINVQYKLFGYAALNFYPNKNEKILQQDKNSLLIEYNESNKFKIYQRLLAFGGDCKIISPKEIQEEIKSKLLKMLEIYKNE